MAETGGLAALVGTSRAGGAHPVRLHAQVRSERILLPIFRLPTLIHTRSGNAKYLYEISHGHPLWMNSIDADQFGFDTEDLVRITTDIGYYRCSRSDRCYSN